MQVKHCVGGQHRHVTRQLKYTLAISTYALDIHSVIYLELSFAGEYSFKGMVLG